MTLRPGDQVSLHLWDSTYQENQFGLCTVISTRGGASTSGTLVRVCTLSLPHRTIELDSYWIRPLPPSPLETTLPETDIEI